MATAQDIIVRALRRIGIHAEEEALEATDAAAHFNTLTDMLNQWVLGKDIKSFSAPALASAVSLTIYDDTVLTDTITFGVTANLAARIAGSMNAPIPPDVVMDADLGKSAITRLHVLAQLTASTYDKSISYMPSQRYIEPVDTTV